ncbi:MAG: hypothetical protein KGD63_06815 [Candidatus Lokiarchaeota archaeon]|nr:hypothetical protein [Candidatus Lokiarchaeota archaeon]
MKKSSSILTVRIHGDLDESISDICKTRGLKKAVVVREYLEKAKFFLIDHNSIKSKNENNLILLKRTYFRNLLEKIDEINQIELGTELAQFINDLARLEGKIDDIQYKIDICEEYGMFPKFIDKENYILFSKKFGPQKFVEAFVWILITKGDKGDFDKQFIKDDLLDSSKLNKRYEEIIQPIKRDSSYFAFEYAKIL